MKKYYLILFLVVITCLSIVFLDYRKLSAEIADGLNKDSAVNTVFDNEYEDEILISPGSTYSELMEEAGVSRDEANQIYESAKDVYDLVKIRGGKFFSLYFNRYNNRLIKFVYAIDSEEELIIKKIFEDDNYFWDAEIIPINYFIKIKTSEGIVESSMYQAAIDNDIDERAIIELADAFQWTIDFAMDPRKGDSFKFIYEERYLKGKYIMPGRILAGKYINDGQPYEIYYFEEDGENKGYFDQDGNSVQKMFLKAPVAYKYISSGFTTGLRYIKAFDVSTGHRAIDYAAAIGTPIRAVGDGTITFAGWNGSYGNFLTVHHNATYSTNYGHLSSFAVKTGQKVKQGDVIGYVGSTGFSTGPHLHYEMVKYGLKVNPLKEILPPGEPIKEENQERFFKEIKEYQEQLK